MVSERSTEQDPENTTDDTVGRRKYLALCGSVTAAGALAGVAGVGSATEQPDESAPDDDAHTLVVAGTGSLSSFEVTVSGEISPLHSNGALSTTGTVGPAAEGTVDEDSRSYHFAGDITNFQSTDAVSVYVDGVRIPNDAF
ncbi:hypothetical protein E6P09_16415 (plasmid) [Haloferax mediterranei ATCC 33500]|uniref:Uncharacterized protein n=1 Tax=Haloferax mediterranei (strain ATCC 33500 / DSM 1411 / JCM 8866 / NBRC 14739 / NCIMB 2177 / R-4) TaxID=523841 RepID=I3RB12_HALMT|nr:hypothetical protein [Haloferax mediterranei]AFK21422.1 hypothetical protein HFX_6300 [Haloferax mediterranei ATCC 33500]AHZ24508.1 hypothetical protein BM92_16495 [Haloferax mediterranei ATCC 33500]ELZ97260.1 hypothetical protein C439_18098 [Haloferax mediterranei ATCC 33500]MDX5990438.1 hypothetical protein [Haloferax mediterranei ATCC 33500]QCQ76906.1 hypothetical protein E6P09_16415 [Haloferax mediterranei ATCC 33500]